MFNVLIVLIIIASILMCLIVLVQNSKGGGLSSTFSSSNQIMGVRKTTDIVEKTTWGLAATMVILSIATTYFVPRQDSDSNIMNIQAPTPMSIPQAAGSTTSAAAAAAATEAPMSDAAATPDAANAAE